MVYPPTGSTAYVREISTPPTLLRSTALIYIYLLLYDYDYYYDDFADL